ncbi:hypothetical protein TrLO_g7134, partial [Triparma laevis f. longispina]
SIDVDVSYSHSWDDDDKDDSYSYSSSMKYSMSASYHVEDDDTIDVSYSHSFPPNDDDVFDDDYSYDFSMSMSMSYSFSLDTTSPPTSVPTSSPTSAPTIYAPEFALTDLDSQNALTINEGQKFTVNVTSLLVPAHPNGDITFTLPTHFADFVSFYYDQTELDYYESPEYSYSYSYSTLTDYSSSEWYVPSTKGMLTIQPESTFSGVLQFTVTANVGATIKTMQFVLNVAPVVSQTAPTMEQSTAASEGGYYVATFSGLDNVDDDGSERLQIWILDEVDSEVTSITPIVDLDRSFWSDELPEFSFSTSMSMEADYEEDNYDDSAPTFSYSYSYFDTTTTDLYVESPFDSSPSTSPTLQFYDEDTSTITPKPCENCRQVRAFKVFDSDVDGRFSSTLSIGVTAHGHFSGAFTLGMHALASDSAILFDPKETSSKQFHSVTQHTVFTAPFEPMFLPVANPVSIDYLSKPFDHRFDEAAHIRIENCTLTDKDGSEQVDIFIVSPTELSEVFFTVPRERHSTPLAPAMGFFTSSSSTNPTQLMMLPPSETPDAEASPSMVTMDDRDRMFPAETMLYVYHMPSNFMDNFVLSITAMPGTVDTILEIAIVQTAHDHMGDVMDAESNAIMVYLEYPRPGIASIGMEFILLGITEPLNEAAKAAFTSSVETVIIDSIFASEEEEDESRRLTVSVDGVEVTATVTGQTFVDGQLVIDVSFQISTLDSAATAELYYVTDKIADNIILDDVQEALLVDLGDYVDFPVPDGIKGAVTDVAMAGSYSYSYPELTLFVPPSGPIYVHDSLVAFEDTAVELVMEPETLTYDNATGWVQVYLMDLTNGTLSSVGVAAVDDSNYDYSYSHSYSYDHDNLLSEEFVESVFSLPAYRTTSNNFTFEGNYHARSNESIPTFEVFDTRVKSLDDFKVLLTPEPHFSGYMHIGVLTVVTHIGEDGVNATKQYWQDIATKVKPVVDMFGVSLTGKPSLEDSPATVTLENIDIIDPDSESVQFYVFGKDVNAPLTDLSVSLEDDYGHPIKTTLEPKFAQLDGDKVVVDGSVMLFKVDSSQFVLDEDGLANVLLYTLPNATFAETNLTFVAREHFSGSLDFAAVYVVSDEGLESRFTDRESRTMSFAVDFMPVADDFALEVEDMMGFEGDVFDLNVSAIMATDRDSSEVIALSLFFGEDFASTSVFATDKLSNNESLVAPIEFYSHTGEMLYRFDIPVGSMLAPVKIAPRADFSGDIHVWLKAVVTDTGASGFDTRTKNGNLTLTVHPMVKQEEPHIFAHDPVAEGEYNIWSVSGLTMVDTDGSETMKVWVLSVDDLYTDVMTSASDGSAAEGFGSSYSYSHSYSYGYGGGHDGSGLGMEVFKTVVKRAVAWHAEEQKIKDADCMDCVNTTAFLVFNSAVDADVTNLQVAVATAEHFAGYLPLFFFTEVVDEATFVLNEEIIYDPSEVEDVPLSLTCMRASKKFEGDLWSIGCGSTVQIGSGGSTTGCGRAYEIILLFVPLHANLEKISEAIFNAVAGPASSWRSPEQIRVNMWGLGVRGSISVFEEDVYIGPESGDPEGNEFLGLFADGAVVNDGDALQLDLLAYLQAVRASAPDDDVASKFVGLRLAGDDDFGCSSSCGGACPIKRFNFNGLSLNVDLPPVEYVTTVNTMMATQNWFEVFEPKWTPVVDMIDVAISSYVAADEDTTAFVKLNDVNLIDVDGSEMVAMHLLVKYGIESINPLEGVAATSLIGVPGLNVTNSLIQQEAVIVDGKIILTSNGAQIGDALVNNEWFDESGGFKYIVYDLPMDIDGFNVDSARLSFLPFMHFSGQVNLMLLTTVVDGVMMVDDGSGPTIMSETRASPFQIEFMPVADDFSLVVANQTIAEQEYGFIIDVASIDWTPVVDMFEVTISGDDVSDEDTVARIKISGINLIDTDGSEQMSLYLVAQNPTPGSSVLEMVEMANEDYSIVPLSPASGVFIDGDLVVNGGEYVLDTPEGLVDADFVVYKLPPVADEVTLSILPIQHFSGQVNLMLVSVVTDGSDTETRTSPFQIEFMPVADDFSLVVAN